MFDNKMSDDAVKAVFAEGTYTTVVRPHQLRRADVYTEVLGKSVRRVVIEKVTYGEIVYRGRPVPVLLVHGHDEMNQRPVLCARTGWEFLEVTRTGEAPQYRRVLEQLNTSTQFVY